MKYLQDDILLVEVGDTQDFVYEMLEKYTLCPFGHIRQYPFFTHREYLVGFIGRQDPYIINQCLSAYHTEHRTALVYCFSALLENKAIKTALDAADRFSDSIVICMRGKRYVYTLQEVYDDDKWSHVTSADNPTLNE